jgi:hypothetical protein
MADNIDITEGSGKIVATDDVGGVQYQRIKLDLGTDGAAAPALAGAGAVATGVQRVTLASDDPAVVDLAAIEVLLGTIDADTGAIKTAVELLDNAVDGNYLDCNMNIAGTDVVGGAGAVAAGVQRVTLASDDPAVALLGTIDTDTGVIAGDTTSIDGKITACNTGAVVLAAGSAAFGKLAANSGVDIGDVDVTSMPANVTASGTLTAAAQTVSVTPPNGCSAASLQITGTWVGQIEFEGTVDGTNYQAIEASNGTQTVNATTTNDIFLLPGAGYLTIRTRASSWTSGTANITFIATIGTTSAILTGSIPAGTNAIGTVTANLSATDNAVLDTIDAVLDTINAKLVTGTVIGDVNLGATDNAVLDDIAARVTSAETALQIIDDWDAVHDSAVSSDGPQLMAAYDSTKPTAVADGDAVRVLADEYGRLLSGVEKTAWQAVYDSSDATGEGEVVKASAASTIVVLQSFVISSDVEGWVKLQDEDSTALTGKFWLKAGGGVAITLPDKCPIVLGVDKDLEVICEAAGDISVTATGYTIPG